MDFIWINTENICMHVWIIFRVYVDNTQIIQIYIHTSCLDIPFNEILSSPWERTGVGLLPSAAHFLFHLSISH